MVSEDGNPLIQAGGICVYSLQFDFEEFLEGIWSRRGPMPSLMAMIPKSSPSADIAAVEIGGQSPP
jgi:hypothetical protein